MRLKELLKEVELFDVYEGKNLEPGKKSYAVSFLLQDDRLPAHCHHRMIPCIHAGNRQK